MSIPAESTVPHWQVTRVDNNRLSTDQSGNSTFGKLVQFRFDDGTPGTVLIPDSAWGGPEVRPMIEAAAAQLADIRYMQGGQG